jgi:effector-binding domain-containing protein
MQIKEVKPLTFLYHSIRTTTSGLTPQLGSIAKALYKEAAALDLDVTGPVYWQYVGFDSKPDAEFTLHIALPVAEAREGYSGKFAFQRTEPFKCLATMHEGNWTDIPQTYRKLFGYIASQGLQPAGLDREVYINVNFADPEANVTEVQIGIK